MSVTRSKEKVTPSEWAIGLGAVAVFAVFMLRWGIEGIVHSREIQIVPDVVGKSISGALDSLSPLNLSILKEGTEFNASVPIGSVLRQVPPAGTKVREGKTIRVVVSQGGETVFAPAILALPLRNAEMLLRQNQLILGEVTESYSLRMEKGLVLSQDPKAESSVERNSMVSVVVSAGAPPEGVRLMPEFTRKNVAEASQWAQSSGVKLVVEKDMKSRFPYGTIQSQEPAVDTPLSEGRKVKIVISGRKEGQGGAGLQSFTYKVPQGSSDGLVRIVLVDDAGERELFNGMRQPGSRIDLDIPEGSARVKIFLNGILVEERDL